MSFSTDRVMLRGRIEAGPGERLGRRIADAGIKIPTGPCAACRGGAAAGRRDAAVSVLGERRRSGPPVCPKQRPRHPSGRGREGHLGPGRGRCDWLEHGSPWICAVPPVGHPREAMSDPDHPHEYRHPQGPARTTTGTGGGDPSRWRDGEPVAWLTLANVHPRTEICDLACVIHKPERTPYAVLALIWRDDRGSSSGSVRSTRLVIPTQIRIFIGDGRKKIGVHRYPPTSSTTPYPPSNPFDGIDVHGCCGDCRRD